MESSLPRRKYNCIGWPGFGDHRYNADYEANHALRFSSMSAAQPLESYLAGKWVRGQGIETELIDPTNGTVLATVSARDLDLDAALTFAREKGGPALRVLNYAARAKLLGAIVDVLAANRARYEEIAIANSGNTKTDAAIDIDGSIGTLKYYSRLGASLGEAKSFIDSKPVRLTKAENYQAIHLLMPRTRPYTSTPSISRAGDCGKRRPAPCSPACLCWQSQRRRRVCSAIRWCAMWSRRNFAGGGAQPAVRRHRRLARPYHWRRCHRVHRLILHREPDSQSPKCPGARNNGECRG
jgi:hypothetical protein